MTASPAPGAAPTVSVWRRSPYRLLFLIALPLAWAGVLHWFLMGIGVVSPGRYTELAILHSIAQIQGLMMCFAVGFLFTMIPRRTGTAPPSPVELVIAALAPVATVVAAWLGSISVSQLFWLVLMGMLVVFAVRRFRSGASGRRPPDSFVWIPVALLTGVVGSLLTAAYGMLGQAWFALHELGKLLLLQGMFLGLVVGVGGMVLPLITCGDPPPDSSPATRRNRILHLVAALALVGTFVVENQGHRALGYGLRAGLVALLLVTAARIYRTPRRPGAHRWLVWLSAWMLPVGYAVGALWPGQFQAGLHVVFLGGFALMAFAVGLHVTLAHADDPRVFGRPWQSFAFGGLFLLAVAFRALVQFDRQEWLLWLTLASGAFLVGTLVWATLILPSLLRE